MNSNNTKKGWREYVFSEVSEINPKRKLIKGMIAKFVSMADLKEYNKKIQGITLREFTGGSKFSNGDTLMARITPCLENGKTAFVDILDENEVGCGSTEFIVLSGKKGISINSYIYYLATSPEVRQLAIKSMTGTSGRQRIEYSVFNNIPVMIPGLDEQRSISKILSDIDDKIELSRQMNKTLEAIGQALFKQWFVDYEFPDKDGKPYKSSGGKMIESELGEIPEGWDVKPLDQVADFLNGLALQKFPQTDDRYLPAIKIRELNQGITESSDKVSPDISPEYVVDDGDILFSWSGSLQICIWGYGRGALNQHLFKVTSSNYPKWFYFYWTRYHLPEFQQIAEGKATTMGHIQRRHLSSAFVTVPHAITLESMTRTLSPIIEQIIVNSVEVRKLSEIRDSLLPRLMSGKIRVLR